MSRARQPVRIGTQFEIDGTLLAEDTAGWRNLGLWSQDTHRQYTALAPNGVSSLNVSGQSYTEDHVYTEGHAYALAAEALASRVGEAAQLNAHTHLLDMACGHGASLWCWRRRFGVVKISAIELQTACIETLRHAPPNWNIVQGRFDTLPLPTSISPGCYDAVVCVDAAYHARSLSAFLQVARTALHESGRLAFTTLAVNPSYGELPKLLTFMLAKAHIPMVALQTPTDIKNSMKKAGFYNVRIELLDEKVFAGFAQYVRDRGGQLKWTQKMSPGWLKIKATAALCDTLADKPRLHYVLVSGVATAI